MNLTFLVLRNGMVGGFLLVLEPLDPVSYDLDYYLFLVLSVGLLVCTAMPTRKRRPDLKLMPMVLVSWAAWALPLVVVNTYRNLTYHGVQLVHPHENVTALLFILFLGGLFSFLVVSVFWLVTPTHK